MMTEGLAIRLIGVGASYGRDRVVEDVTTPRFVGGDVIALLGPNGSGKSTLLRRVAGLLDGPGQIELHGATRADMGYLPQDHASTAALTVYESVILAGRRDAGWRVSDAELTAVDATLAALGITSLAFRDLDALSGGQRQLAAIAQSLVRRPRVLLMDEPTSALDLHRQMGVLKTVRGLAQERGIIVFVSLHDVNLALRFADHAMVLAEGRLFACGPGAAIITEGMMRAVFRVEARIETCSRGRKHVLVDAPAE